MGGGGGHSQPCVCLIPVTFCCRISVTHPKVVGVEESGPSQFLGSQNSRRGMGKAWRSGVGRIRHSTQTP